MKALFDVINIFGVVLEILVAISFFDEVSDKKQIPAYRGEGVCLAFIMMQSIVIVHVKQQAFVTIILFFMILGISFIYKLTMSKRILFSIMIMILYLLSEMVIGLVLTQLANVSVEQLSQDVLYYMQGAVMSKLMVFVIIKIIAFYSIKSEAKIAGYIYVPLMVLPMVTFLVVYVLAEYTFPSQDKMLLILSTVAAAGLILANMLIFYLFEYQIKMTEAEKRQQLLKQQLEDKVEYYKELSRRQQITNKTMHDLKNQLFGLAEALKKNPQEGTDKIYNMCKDILLPHSLQFTGMEGVDALITTKIQLMEKRSIKFSHSIFMSENNDVDILDLCVLLGNLMDNAMEANEKVPMEDRFISLKIVQQKDYLSINVSNAIVEYVKIGQAGIATTKNQKELHGFGLPSIKAIADKYNGNYIFRQNENEFEAIIMLKTTKTVPMLQKK